MVLLVRRCRQALGGDRGCQMLVLGLERGGGHLGDHHARVDPGLGRQEGRQARQGGIGQERDAPLGDGADLGQRQSDPLGRERHGLGVEVAARQDLAGVGEDEGVVGDAVGLALEHGTRLEEQVETGAHHLRLAAETIGVLDPLAREMGGADGAALEQAGETRRGLGLARLAAHGVQARIERNVRAQGGIDAHGAGDQGRIEEAHRGMPGSDRQRRRNLGAVEKGQALLGAEGERR